MVPSAPITGDEKVPAGSKYDHTCAPVASASLYTVPVPPLLYVAKTTPLSAAPSAGVV